jgi:hypothetical protein
MQEILYILETKLEILFFQHTMEHTLQRKWKWEREPKLEEDRYSSCLFLGIFSIYFRRKSYSKAETTLVLV